MVDRVRSGFTLPLPREPKNPGNFPVQFRGSKIVDPEIQGGTVRDLSYKSQVAKGRVGHVGITSAVTGISTEADVTGLTVTFTAEAERYYKITWIGRVQQQTSAGTVTARITDGSNVSKIAWVKALSAAAVDNVMLVVLQSPGAGSVTWKARIGTSAGTVDVNASSTAPSYIIVEDMGL